jgi:cytochrome P450
MTTITEFNPFRPEVKENPYPYYAWMRKNQPMYFNDRTGFWCVTRYADVVQALRSPQIFSSAYGIGPEKTPGIPMMITQDPPVHTRLRSLVNKAFTPRMVAQNEPRVQQIVDELLDAVVEKGSFDLVQDLAYPLPVIVIAEMLGVEPSRRDDFKRWSDDVIHSLAGSVHGHDQAQMMISMQQFGEYFMPIVERRRAQRENDLITALVMAQEEREALSTGEIFNFLLLLLVAGNETTTNLIGNGALALLQNPEQAQKLRERPDLATSTVEEALRYDSPIQGFFRTTTQDAQIGGTTIPADSKVFVLYASANRDGAQFPDPDRFDIDRTPNNHVAFGLGIHFCLGAPLARLEGRLATQSVLRRMRNIRIDPSGVIDRVDNPLLRGLKHLPLLFEPA